MFNVRRLFGFLATGEIPERTALDEAIEREEARRGVSDELVDEMLAFLRGGSPASSVGRSPLSTEAQDAAPASLEEHDEQYHPEGYREGDSCKFREERAKGDRADSEVGGQRTKDKGQRGGLSNRKRKEWGDLMRRKHPEIDADRLLEELGKIEDRKIQGDAFRWVMKGAVRLPEDLYKVEKAREMADKAKVDPMQYNTPQACIDALSGKVTLKDKPIDPDTVPELTDKKVLPMGVTTYLVQDDAQGQQKMREIINTHWGKDANPWCLLHGDGEGNLSDGSDGGYDAWHYWNHYNALPKRVAFKDGKLLAFMATDVEPSDNRDVDEDEIAEKYPKEAGEFENDTSFTSPNNFIDWMFEKYPEKMDGIGEQWWDRQDQDHVGIPLGNIPVPDDKFGRWSYFEIRDGEMKRVGWFLKGEPDKPGYKKWYQSGRLEVEIDKNGNQLDWFEDGSPSQLFDDLGNKVTFRENGQVHMIQIGSQSERFSCMFFDEDGNVSNWKDKHFIGYDKESGKDDPDANQSDKEELLAYIPKAKELFNKYDRRGKQ